MLSPLGYGTCVEVGDQTQVLNFQLLLQHQVCRGPLQSRLSQALLQTLFIRQILLGWPNSSHPRLGVSLNYGTCVDVGDQTQDKSVQDDSCVSHV